ncbi:hypothetical protein LR48_Vigan09g200900 [Vigna angularis]|uniref:Uncharacterized protein n=1 Tax=Phaseolus angularis TaxID=3914 RepID=A0A0L9VE67_PHAAN|nr:hypothetical protein LR48_Vigan09g200900 [Vigna angularis]
MPTTTSRAPHCSVFTSTSTRLSSFSASSKRSSPSAHIHTDDHCNDKTDVQVQWTTQGKTKGYYDRAPGWCGNWHSHQLPPEVSPFRPNYSYVTVPSKLQLCDGDLLPFPRMTSLLYVKTSSHGISGSNRLLSLATVILYNFQLSSMSRSYLERSFNIHNFTFISYTVHHSFFIMYSYFHFIS